MPRSFASRRMTIIRTDALISAIDSAGETPAQGGGTPALRFIFLLPGKADWIFVSALAEAALQAGGQSYGRFAKAVAEFVGGGQRIFPALLGVPFEQIDLHRLGTEG